jgi:hypothetical protein
MAMLTLSSIKKDALDDLELLAQVVRHKQTFYPSAWAQYASAAPGSFRIVPTSNRVAGLKEDYRNMSLMIFGTPPNFESILETLSQLEREVNNLRG